ncbi:ankyrin repeat-containing protein [Quercus suber]|uniref:Ankyrin repeat-containing protein n=2 Tax=Quercus suber TaxID=58331 RepID=A0AAW0JIC7_QUESU
MEVMEKCPSAIVQGEDSGWTPLHIASFMGNVKLVKLFLENGTSSLAYVKNKEGLSAFHIAAQEGNALVMKEFITTCPDIFELMDNTGRTALHFAAERGQQEAVNFFLERPDLMGLIDEQDEEGNTPMHLAAIRGHYKVLLQLAHRRDVDINATNKEGLTTMDKNVSSTKIRIYLKTYIKKRLNAEGSRKGLRQIFDMCTRRLDPQVPEKERGLKKIKIESIDEGAVNATAIEEKPQKGQTAKENEVKNTVSESEEEISDKSMSVSERVRSAGETNLLVATIIATVTFTAAFTVPGGYESGAVNSGSAVLSKRAAFKAFMIADAVAFASSSASILIYMYSANIRRALPFSDRRRKTELALLLSEFSISALLIAFMTGTYAVVPHSLGISVAVIICFGFYSGIQAFLH